MKTVLLLTLVALGLTACQSTQSTQSTPSGRAGTASEPNQTDASQLNTVWALRQINGKVIDKAQFPRRVPYMDVNLRDKHVLGSTGCNRFGGTFQATATTLKIGPLTSTKMACANGMSVEAELLAALETADTYKIDGKSLIVYKGSTELMTFGRGD